MLFFYLLIKSTRRFSSSSINSDIFSIHILIVVTVSTPLSDFEWSALRNRIYNSCSFSSKELHELERHPQIIRYLVKKYYVCNLMHAPFSPVVFNWQKESIDNLNSFSYEFCWNSSILVICTWTITGDLMCQSFKRCEKSTCLHICLRQEICFFSTF